MDKMRKKTFEDFKKYVEIKKGILLSEEYVNKSTKVRIKCDKEHIWEVSFGTIYYDKSWCPFCKEEERKKDYFKKIKKYSEEKKGKCLSDEYINNYTKMKFQCNEGHIWESTSASVLNGKSWCPICNIERRRNGIGKVKKEIEERGGILLSEEYIDVKTRIKVQCKKGHVWETCYDYIRDGCWCLQCNVDDRKEFYFQRLKDYIESRGGKIISREYINAETKMKFMCEKKHIWDDTPTSIIHGKHWCSICNKGKQKKIIKKIIKREKDNSYFEKLKKIIFQKEGILLSEKYVDNRTRIKIQCNKGHIWETNSFNIVSYNWWCPQCKKEEKNKYYFERLKNYVKDKGGKVLSKEYIGSKIKLKFQCKNGHIWETKPHTIIKCNSWCPICKFDKKRKKIEEVRKLVEDRGGKLLTKEYKNNMQQLKIICDKGHLWQTTYMSLKNGHWCKICANLNQKLTFEERKNGFKEVCEFVENRGGECLSPFEEYESSNSKLKFRCKYGHVWEVVVYVIKSKTWCPVCSQSFSEKYFRFVMEKLFNKSFNSIRPSWMKIENGRDLQIDGYNKELKLGFEYQGGQHFKFIPFFHKKIEKFERLQFLDKLKKKILKEHGIFMLYPTYRLKKENYKNYILSKIRKTKFEEFVDKKIEINLSEFYNNL